MRRLGTLLAIGLIAVTLSACQSASFFTSPTLEHKRPNQKILLLPAEVQLGSLTTGGIFEPNAEWTKAGRQHMIAALRRAFKKQGIGLIESTEIGDLSRDDHTEIQLIKLHGAVGRSIHIHQYQAPAALPSKNGRFNWSLGPKVRALKEKYDADYGLFVFMKDSYTSGGRAAMIFGAALLGVHVSGGQQLGFASLVDLDTGEVIWFNRIARGTGDLRDAEGAEETVSVLLSEFPK